MYRTRRRGGLAMPLPLSLIEVTGGSVPLKYLIRMALFGAACLTVAACGPEPSQPNSVATPPAATASDQVAEQSTPAQSTADAGKAIDDTNAYNHRVCIAGGGIWNNSAMPTKIPDHPFVGWCNGKDNDKPVCAGSDLNSKCWKFVIGDSNNKTSMKALPEWTACKTDPPDPLC